MFHFLVAGRNPTHFFFTNNPKNLSSFLNSTILLLHSRSLHRKPIIIEEEEEPINNNKKNDSSSLTTTVSYLVSSCGLSPQSALSASKKINIKTTEKPDSNLALLKSYGFSDNQIIGLISRFPKLLLTKWEKTIKPKFDYFNSIGYSGSYLTTLVSSNPLLLRSSLQSKLKSNYDLLRPIFSTNQQLLRAIHRSRAWLLTVRLEANFFANVRILQDHGVPASHIAKLASKFPTRLLLRPAYFKRTVESLRKMGFDPLPAMFIHGVSTMSGMSISTWERKVAFLKSLGWSEAQLISAFMKKPEFMALSEDSIKRVMDFFAQKMNYGPSFVAAHPVLLTFSLEKRFIPRCSVVRFLESKGLAKRSKGVHFLRISEAKFMNKYVMKYEAQVPGLHQAYKSNTEFVGL